MGCWDTAGKLVKGAAQAAEEKGLELQAIKMRLESKSSSELKDIVKGEGFFSASRTEKSIAMKILRDRGDA